MQTPSSQAGEWTEVLMFRITQAIANRKEPALTVAQYNAVYGRVHEFLSEISKVTR